MKFYEAELQSLRASDRTFKSVYGIMKAQFTDEIFGEELVRGKIVKTTYGELFERAERIAGGLSSLENAPERSSFVALEMNNSPLWVECFFGILMAGYRPALINMRMSEEIREKEKLSCSATLVLTDAEKDGALNAKTLLTSAPISDPVWENEIAIFTSGTTGQPKTVIYNGAAICEQLLLSGDIIKKNPSIKYNRKLEIRQLAFLPFYHIFGLMASLLWFSFFGRTFVFLPDIDEKTIQYVCSRRQVTHFFAVPAVWDRVTEKLLREVRRQGKEKVFERAIDFSNSLQNVFPRFGRAFARKVLFKKVRRQVLGETLAFCITGGGRVSTRALEIMNGLGYSLHSGYGMSEVGIVSVELDMRSARRLDNTVGIPFYSYEYKIREDGALLLRGDGLYTAMISGGVRTERDREEYFVTRDIVKQNEYGRIEIIGRIDDMIIGPDGENVSPEMIEEKMAALGAHVCAVAKKDGDTEKMIFVAQGSSSEAFEAVLAKKIFDAADTLPPAERPSGVYFSRQPIPESNGKISHTALRRLIESGEFSMVRAKRDDGATLELLQGELYRANLERVKSVFADVLGIDAENIDDNADFISDLGGDSLGYYTLMNRLSESFGRDIPTSVSPLSSAAFAVALSEDN